MPEKLARVRRIAWVALLLVGAVQGWVFRHVVSPDGVAYLDLSDAIVSGRLRDLVNGYWSPIYPVIVGVLRLLVSPTPLAAPYWEFALLHVVSFLGYALSLAAFEWFLRALDEAGARWENGQLFATPLGRAFAYLVFAVASLGMISVAGTVPDFFLSAAVFVTLACLLRLLHDRGNKAIATRLGLALGFGALAKSFFFPLGAVVLGTLAIGIRGPGGGRTVLRSATVFVAVTLPWLALVSASLGRPSTGLTGSLNYAWYVNQQQAPNSGALPALALTREHLPLSGVAVLDSSRGTNPLWYDPARWHRDVRARFSARQQWTRFSHSLRYYLFVTAPFLVAIVSIGAGATRRDLLLTLRRAFVVLIPCVAALGAYALVYTLSRLVSPFIVGICLVLAAAFPRDATLRPGAFSTGFGVALFAIQAGLRGPIRSTVTVTYGLALFLVPWLALRARPAIWRWAASFAAVLVLWLLPVLSGAEAGAASVAVGALMWVGLRRGKSDPGLAVGVRRAFAVGAVVAFAIPSFAFGVVAVVRYVTVPVPDSHPEWTKAQRLIREGAPEGSRVAVLGNPENAGWARLARFQIVAVVPDDQVEAFHKLNAGDRDRVMRVFARAGATRLVSRPAP